MYGKVLFNYTANNSNIEDDDCEVDLFEGSFVEIMEMYDDGWWLVQSKSKAGVSITGLAPSNYIELEEYSSSKLDNKTYHSPKVFDTTNPTTVWRELPPGWKEAIDAKSNDTYYYNALTGAVQWNFPNYEKQQQVSSDLAKGRQRQFSPDKAATTESSLQQVGQGAEGKNHSSAGHSVTAAASAVRMRTVRQALSPTRSSRSVPGSPPHAQGLEVGNNRAVSEARDDGKGKGRDVHRVVKAEAEAEAEAGTSPGNWSREPLQGTASASDLRRLRHLREQAEQKITALRLAVSSHENNSTLKKTATRHEPAALTSPSPTEEPVPSARTERSEDRSQVRVQSAKQKRGKRKESANPTLPQVSLDPKSLSFISQIVTERIEKEFSQRDGALLDQVRALIQQQQQQQQGVSLPAIAIANPGRNPNPNPPPLQGRQEEEGDSLTLPALSVPKRQSPYLKAVRREADRDRATGRDGDKSGSGSGSGAADREARSAAARLSLSHCFGYDGDVGRHGHSVQGRNLLLLSIDPDPGQGDQLLLFPAAAVVVLMSLRSQRQRFFAAHNDDVTCIASHPDLQLVASGQKGREGGVVFVWDPVHPDLTVVSRLVPPACASRGICSVSFSATGLLCCMSLEEARSLFIFDFKAAALLATVKVGQVDAGQVLFNPSLFSPHCATLATFGGKHVKFWSLRCELDKDQADKDSFDDVSSFKGRKLKGRRPNPNPVWHYSLEGSTGSIPHSGTISDAGTCVVCCPDLPDPASGRPRSRWISGSSSGSILLWQQIEDDRSTAATGWLWRGKARLLSIVTEAHDSPLLCLDLLARRGAEEAAGPMAMMLASSSADGLVSLWQVSAAPAHRATKAEALPVEHLLSLQLPAGDMSRAICWQQRGGLRAVVGTVQNNIHVLTYPGDEGDEGGGARLRLLQSGHAGKVRRLCVHPTRPWLFVSLSADGSVRMWHAGTHSQLQCWQSVSLTGEGRVATSCAFSPDGRCLAVGDDSGQVGLLDNAWLHRLLDSEGDLTCDGSSSSDWRLLGRRSLLAHPPAAATPPSSSRGRAGPGKGASPAPAPASGSGSSSDKNHSRRSGSGSGSGLGMGGNIGAIVAIQFCRVTSLLAASCSQHNLVHLLRLEPLGQGVALRRLCVCRGHTSPARSLDFSSDGSTLLSSDSREVFFWDTSSGSRRLSRERDEEAQQWQSWSSNIGSPVAGAANTTTTVEPGSGATGSAHPGDVNCVARSPDSRLLAVGCSQVRAVKLFSYPCAADAVPCAYGGHASPVVDIAFVHTSAESNSSLAVISAGGNDCCILQWDVLPLHS